MPIVAFGDIGKAAKGLLGGDKATGTFQFDPKLSVSSTTSSGVAFTATATQKGETVAATLKAAYSTKKYSVDAAVDPSGKVTASASISELAPGVKLSSSAVVPDISTAKLTLDYVMPYAAAKATFGLTATPVVDLSASTGYQAFVLGAETSYDTAKSAVTKYNFALGYHAADFQFAALLSDQLKTLKLSYMHSLTSTSTVGAEVSRKLASGDTAFTLAYARKLTNGALTKFKLDGSGLLSALYETKLATGEKVTGSLQLQATELSKPAKYGFAVDLA
ncbi:Mitochondrial outer membrane protein porin 6 [Tetrabaena socialis]|uniref:Mitochondrial outer membrane protein porin 6 n=1 Tax=Tetrabaena socialis TaxID=47790 RepID=A0A2J8A2P3_9CHLO|nr:Mitochondrial outer membrane protein porin 6 [Tetrabaena socialis]|eukprot:PNH06790.1 Mitochondrial outer membrane protein porin 6 [Tetrabaena socialis]